MAAMSKQEILAVIHENNAASVALISRRLGISRQAIHRHIQQLLDEEVIKKEGKPPKVRYMDTDNMQKSTNVVKQDYHVTKADRQAKNQQKSCVVWFTGLSGSGKSTLANALERRLFEMGKNTYVLDGDNIRHGLNKDLTFSAKDRTENIRRIGEVANLMVDGGMFVMTAFISPYIADRNMVRSLLENDEFIEVFVDCPIEVCEQRDVKGLYEKARKGIIKDFTGIDAPYEAPERAEVVVKTDQHSIDECVDQIVEYMQQNEYFKEA